MRRLTVAVDPPYDIVVGAGVLDLLADAVVPYRRVAVVTQSAIAAAHGARVLGVAGGAEPNRTTEARLFVMDDGEDAKTLASVESLCRSLAAWGLLRDDAIVALGGGVVGDTAGFVASVYYRGVAVVQAPTTLLAMVDAAIGGKTAVNLPEGKNLVGVFHQPRVVLADVATLASLPEREYIAGLGEVAKYAAMPQGGAVAHVLAAHADAVRSRDPEVLTDLVAECAALKAAVVAGDPEERTGIRATLNYGHTFAHALETAGAYDLLHGEAVAVGLVFADALAVALGRLDPSVADAHRSLLESLELPTAAPAPVTSTQLLDVMRRDKKASGGLTFVLPGDHGLERVDDPAPSALRSAFHAVGVEAKVGD